MGRILLASFGSGMVGFASRRIKWFRKLKMLRSREQGLMVQKYHLLDE